MLLKGLDELLVVIGFCGRVVGYLVGPDGEKEGISDGVIVMGVEVGGITGKAEGKVGIGLLDGCKTGFGVGKSLRVFILV